MTDLRDHQASDNVVLLMFTEFGRRISDNGSGTDHGAAGIAFAVGEKVKGGIYGEYPSLEPADQEEGWKPEVQPGLPLSLFHHPGRLVQPGPNADRRR